MSKKVALRRIKKTRETGATKLDLAYQGLVKLPPEVFWLENLAMLDFRGNQLLGVTQLHKG